jgi:hypothetical protein
LLSGAKKEEILQLRIPDTVPIQELYLNNSPVAGKWGTLSKTSSLMTRLASERRLNAATSGQIAGSRKAVLLTFSLLLAAAAPALAVTPSPAEKEESRLALQIVSGIPGEAAMLLVGTAMIGLAAAVRRAA